MNRTKSLILQIVTTGLFLILIIPALLNVMAGLMGMAAEGGSVAWQVVAGAVSLLSLIYPLVAIGCILVSWIFFAKEAYDRAMWVSLIPAAWVGVVIVLMVVLFGFLGT